MGFATYRVVILVCIMFLSIRSEKVHALTSIDLALKWREENSISRNLRLLESVSVRKMNSRFGLAPTPSMMFDPNQTNKRRVRRGSDPIHNKC